MNKKVVTMKNKTIGGNRPLICTPLIGSDRDQIAAELEKIHSKKPDIVEWRADYFKNLHDIPAVLDSVSFIRETIGEIPLIFTIRSQKEGGHPISLAEREKLELFTEVCRRGGIDILDYELSNEAENIRHLCQVAKASDVRVILSYHNFDYTPESSVILEKLSQAEIYGADIAKVAVMPTCNRDLLTLLDATLSASQQLNIPIITISMGKLGVITRIFGWIFGSSVTFAIGKQSSAPGQIPIEELRSILKLLQKTMGSD